MDKQFLQTAARVSNFVRSFEELSLFKQIKDENVRLEKIYDFILSNELLTKELGEISHNPSNLTFLSDGE